LGSDAQSQKQKIKSQKSNSKITTQKPKKHFEYSKSNSRNSSSRLLAFDF
jgi:hypothetical protein